MNKAIQYNKYNPIWEPIPKEEQDWRQNMKGRDLVIEIGPGVGLHPIQYAKDNPDKYIVAIEKTTEKYNKFKRRLDNHPEIKNLLALHANAIEWITKHIYVDEVSGYFLLYPNPYPKEAQRNKRLMHMPFMEHLIATMQQGAALTIATNMKFFYIEAKEQIKELKLVKDTLVTGNGRTHFERKYLADGQKCYELVFAKSNKKL